VRLSVEQFRAWENKCVTLLGMSGVGKTRLAALLRRHNWFHYSGDYRIGTRYLDEPILDNIKQQAMQVPFLRDLLRSDSIYIANNITVDHLKPLSTFLGKLGDVARGGLPLAEFKRRQGLHHRAEIAAMTDVPEFICKAQAIYGYQHFVNDAGGSLCELDDPQVLELLDRHTLVLYVEATTDDARALIARAEQDPKPLYYREAFLEAELAAYLLERRLPDGRGDRAGRLRALDLSAAVLLAPAALPGDRGALRLQRVERRGRGRDQRARLPRAGRPGAVPTDRGGGRGE
jgi:hypothetical protein